MQDALLSVLPSLVALGMAALVALHLTLNHRSPPENSEERRDAARVLALATGIQAVHFAEEAATGFPERLGALLGLPAMPFSFFLVFNLLWLGVWVASVPGLRSARPAAYFAAWFLAIAGILNGLAHPLLALAAEGYFPGLVTSPFIGSACYWLWNRLRRTTRRGVVSQAKEGI